MSPMTESTRWRIRLPPSQMGALREDGLRHFVMLGRLMNCIRVLQFTYLRDAETDAPVGPRQRIGAFLFLVSVLHEARELLQHVGKTFRQLKAWQNEMVPILRSDVFRDLLRESAAPLRNQAVFHFDEAAITDSLARCDLPEIVLIEGKGKQAGNVHFPLSDLMAITLFTGLPTEATQQEGRFKELLTQTSDLMAAIADAGESVAAEYSEAMGFAREMQGADGTWRAV